MADEKDKVEDGGSTAGIQPLIDAEERRAETSAQDRIDASREAMENERDALREPADIGAAAATKLEASGAFIEDAAKKRVDVDHPAVDNNPRAGTTERQNQIDFNDPTLKDREAVAQRLDEQSGGEG